MTPTVQVESKAFINEILFNSWKYSIKLWEQVIQGVFYSLK